MTSDLDIYRTASVLIREHGDEADFVAAQRADNRLSALAHNLVWSGQRTVAVAKPKKRNPRKWAAANWGSLVGFGLAVLAALAFVLYLR
jgi:hypothetical protein